LLSECYLLDELKSDIARETSASFEPSIDYVVTKIPRFAFEVLAHGHHFNSTPSPHILQTARRQ
jgi:carbamoylphosphate synthase large subunit